MKPFFLLPAAALLAGCAQAPFRNVSFQVRETPSSYPGMPPAALVPANDKKALDRAETPTVADQALDSAAMPAPPAKSSEQAKLDQYLDDRPRS